jgi:hypothetical protein
MRLFAQSKREHWTYDTLLTALNAMSPQFHEWSKRLPVYMKEFLRGFRTALHEMRERYELVFAYEYQGRIYPIDSPEYRELSPQAVADHSTANGTVWRDALNTWYSRNPK